MFNTGALKKGIEDIEKNILIFEETIKEERARITEYRSMIDDLERKKLEQAEAQANVIVEVVRDGDKC